MSEKQNPGPATHDRDWTVTEQPNATHRRIDEAGDSVPSGQDSMTRRVQNLRISHSPAASAALPAPPPATMRNPRRPPRRNQKPREYLRCAQCAPDPAAHTASTGGVLMRPVRQKHGGQLLLPDSVGQLRWLDRQACVVCGAISTFQDRRHPGHQDAAASGLATGQQLLQSAQPVPPGEPLDDSPLPNCPIWDVVLTDRERQLLTELRCASTMALPRCVVSRYATAWAESLEGAMSGHQSWALLCRYRCRLLIAEIPKGVDRNSELKQRLHLWEMGHITHLISKVLGQQSSGPLRRTGRTVQLRAPTTFACWKIRFKTEVCTCSQVPVEAMLWIKEVEMVDSVDDLKSSSSVRGTPGPNFEVFDAKIASALNKII